MLELSEACSRGVQYACNALSYEDEAKLVWLAAQGEQHVHDAQAQGGTGAARAAPAAAGGKGDAAGDADAAFEAMGAALVDDLNLAFEEMSAALVDDLQRALD